MRSASVFAVQLPCSPQWIVRNAIRVALIFVFSCLSVPGRAQTAPTPAPRITTPIDETSLARLAGNTHPLARPEFDQGAAPPDLPMQRMLLVLKRSPEQEAALQDLLESQQDKSSANYHHWFTPDEFGQQFGPSDQDMQTVISWLTSHGFRSIQASRGRSVIEFSGTAAQLDDAFHATMHRYAVNGEEHWANANDPQIPTALEPVVAGVFTLHNFAKKPQLHVSAEKFPATIVGGAKPLVTSSTGAHALAPGDYSTIYNVNPVSTATPAINGNGVTIGVIGRSNINIYDVIYFNSFFFGNPSNIPLVVVNGVDPGDLGGDEEAEAVLDTTWAAALAPAAWVKLVVSASTATTDGVDLSELYIIDNNLADVMTESFGICEGDVTSAEATAISQLAEQAAAEGISYLVASGDSGAAGCDGGPNTTVATHSNSVNVLASSRYTVSVGGTEFNENGNDSAYWSSNTSAKETALSYIPEDVWNESCAGAQCPSGVNPSLSAGGGGASAFFSTPWWQSGVTGIPTTNARYLPDVSLTAAGHDPYLICLNNSCQPGGTISLYGVFGTSASVQAFGGIMALVVQKTGSRQGQANVTLYKLAAMENLSQCNASATPALTSSDGCIFNDVTVGNNAVPGEAGYGTTGAPYQAGVGFDLATGLGSVNVANLVNGWSKAQFTSSMTTLTMNGGTPVNITHGTPVPYTITVAAKPPATGTPTGDVTLLATGNAGVPMELGHLTLTGGTASGSTDMIPGGVAQIQAHYSGDQTFGGSDSAAFTNVIVNPEASKTSLAIVTFDSLGNVTNPNATTINSGMPYILSVNVTNAAGTPCKPQAYGGPACPTSDVSLTDVTSGGASQIGPGIFPLDLYGHAEDDAIQLSIGQHTIEADYPFDKNFYPSKATINVTVIAGYSTNTVLTSSDSAVPVSTDVTFTAQVTGQSGGPPITGSVQFQIDGSGGTTVPLATNGTAQFTTSFPSAMPNSHQITARYSGDQNYIGSQASFQEGVLTPDFTLSDSLGNTGNVVIAAPGDSSAPITLTVTGTSGYSGTIALSPSSCVITPAGSLSSCSFSPASITGSGSTQLVINTTAPRTASAPGGRFDFHGGKPLPIAVCLLLFVTLAIFHKQRRFSMAFGCVILLALFGLWACGSGGSGSGNGPSSVNTIPGTPTGVQYSVNITAAPSGTTARSINLTFIVQ